MAEGVRGVGETRGPRAGDPPAGVELQTLAAPCDREAVLTGIVLVGVAERTRGVAHEVGLGTEAGAIVEPVTFHRGVGEIVGLLVQGLLLAVGTVEGVEIGEELLGDRLGDVPRRVPEHRVEPAARLPEHVGKLQLPVEEAHLAGDPAGDGPRLRRRVCEGARQRRVVDVVQRPKPACAPEVHRLLERPPSVRSDEVVAVQARPLGRVVHRHGVHALQHGQRIVVGLGGLREQVGLEQVGAAEESFQVRRQLVLDERPDRLRAGVLLELHAVRVVLVAPLAVLPGHHGVVRELVEPGPDEGVAALDLVVEEPEWQGAVHRLDPERQSAQLHGQGIEVHGIDAALDDMTPQDRLETRLEALVVGAAGNQLVREAGVGGVDGIVSSAPDAEQAHQHAVAVGLEAVVMLERGVERVGQEAQRGQRKRARAAGGVADRQVQDSLGWLRLPAGGRRVRVGLAVRTGRRVVGQGAQRALHGRHGEAGARVEAARALARAAPSDEVPLAGEDDAGNELSRLGREAALEREPALGRVAATGLREQAGRLLRRGAPILRRACGSVGVRPAPPGRRAGEPRRTAERPGGRRATALPRSPQRPRCPPPCPWRRSPLPPRSVDSSVPRGFSLSFSNRVRSARSSMASRRERGRAGWSPTERKITGSPLGAVFNS